MKKRTRKAYRRFLGRQKTIHFTQLESGSWRTVIQASIYAYLFPFFSRRNIALGIKMLRIERGIAAVYYWKILTNGRNFKNPDLDHNYTTRLKKKDALALIKCCIICEREEHLHHLGLYNNSVTIWRHSGGSGCKPRAFLFYHEPTKQYVLHCKIGNRYRTIQGPEELVIPQLPNHLFKDCVEALHKYKTTGKTSWWEIETPLVNTSKFARSGNGGYPFLQE